MSCCGYNDPTIGHIDCSAKFVGNQRLEKFLHLYLHTNASCLLKALCHEISLVTDVR